MLKLNLGCGQNKMAGYINVDKYGTYAPDVVWDLEKFPWPFEANSADEIVMNHSLEHMGASSDIFFGIIKELYRVAVPGAKIHINVPHPRGEAFASDPTHVRPVTPNIFTLFSKKNNAKWQETGEPNTPLGMYLDVDFEIANIQYKLTPHWQEQLNSGKITRDDLNHAAMTYYNVIDEIRMIIQAVK